MLKFLAIFIAGITLTNGLSPIDPFSVAKPQLTEPRQNELTYRLPTNVRPTKYFLKLQVNVDDNLFEGDVTIDLEVVQSTTSIQLNYKEINVAWSEAQLTSGTSGDTQVPADFVDRSDEQIYELHFGQTLAPGFYVLHLRFDGSIRSDLTGLYKSSYTFFNDETPREIRYLAATHLEPTYTRSIFPCFDEPAFKAKFEVHIYHAQKFDVVSNMPAVGVPELVPEMNNYYLTRFQETNVEMSTYLLAFVIAEDYSSYTVAPGLVRVHASSHEIHRVQFAQNFAVESLDYLKNWINRDYQLPKLDFLNIPDFLFGAMENWGLILFKDPYLYRDDDITTIPVRTQQSGALLITHELAHMWFGNEVTPEFWTYIWLSEGFARYFEYYVTDQLIPDWKLMDQFLVTNLQSSFSQDDKLSARAMTTPVSVPAVINNMFDYIVYAKSGCVIRMFQNVMGMDAFQSALRNYIADRSYSTTNPDYLFQHFQKAIDDAALDLPGTIESLFRTWSDHPGYPLIKVTRNTESNSALFEQSRFFVNPTEATGQTFPERSVPITYATSTNRDFDNTNINFWMLPNSNVQSRTINGIESSNWIVVNKQSTGYYRVQYDQHNYDLLIAAVNSDDFAQIHVLNRAQLLDDAINLAKARLVDISVTFGFLNSLRREKDLPSAYAPWATANNALTYLNAYLKGHEKYHLFRQFVANISVEAYPNVEVNAVETRHLHRIHRLSVAKWACLMGAEACLNDVSEVINGMLDGSFKVIDEIKDFVYCSAVKYSSQLTDALSTHLITLFVDPQNNLEEIYRIVTGLGCSNDVVVLNSYLDLLLTASPFVPLTAADRIFIFRAIASGSDNGASVALSYLSDNFIALRNSFGSDSLSSLFTFLGTLVTSQQHLNLISNIVDNYGSMLTQDQQQAINGAITRGTANIDWIAYHQESIFQWLEGNVPGAPDGASSILVNLSVLICSLLFVKFVL